MAGGGGGSSLESHNYRGFEEHAQRRRFPHELSGQKRKSNRPRRRAYRFLQNSTPIQ